MKNKYGNDIIIGKNGHLDENNYLAIFHNKMEIINISLVEASCLLCKYWFVFGKYFINQNKNYLPFHHDKIGFRFINIKNTNVSIAIANIENPMNFKFTVPDFWDELKYNFDKNYLKWKSNSAFI